MIDSPVTTDIDPRGVATVTLNRPAVHNAFDDDLITRLDGILDTLAGDPAVRVVALAANGKSFSAGADLTWMRRVADYTHDQNLADAKRLAGMLRRLAHLPKPTLALVQGAAFGGGVGLVACCDIAIASERALFSLSEVKLGLIPATISPFVIDAIGARQARRLFVTAERFDAPAALALGLVHVVCAADELAARAGECIDALLDNSPQAMAAAKALVRDVAGRPIDDALLDDVAERIARQRVAGEGREGVRAFLEKRRPHWVRC